MKKALALLLIIACSLLSFSCSAPKDIYGTWYNDDNGTRNAIQLSQNEDGENVFIWAVYDIDNDAIESNNSGIFNVSGDTIKFEFEQGREPLKLEYSIENGNLILTSETAVMKLQKYIIE